MYRKALFQDDALQRSAMFINNWQLRLMINSMQLQWPYFYPENCPPAETNSASGVVYRLVRRDPPQAEDFKTFFEENPKFFDGKSIGIMCKG